MTQTKIEKDAKQISDVLPDAEREGEKVDFKDVIGKELCITGFETRKSQHHDGDYVLIDYMQDGKQKWTTTSSKVIIDQLQRVQENLPVKATPHQVKKYYTLK